MHSRFIKLVTIGSLISSLTLAPSISFANGDGSCKGEYNIECRKKRQRKRIRHGIKNEEITRGEAKLLGKDQREVNQAIREGFADDGKLDREERFDVHQELNQRRRHIKRAKHNKRKPDNK